MFASFVVVLQLAWEAICEDSGIDLQKSNMQKKAWCSLVQQKCMCSVLAVVCVPAGGSVCAVFMKILFSLHEFGIFEGTRCRCGLLQWCKENLLACVLQS
jgi:hypothetical protein